MAAENTDLTWTPEILVAGFADSLVPQLVLDVERCVVLASEGVARLFERSRDELVGQPIGQFIRPASVFDTCGERSTCEGRTPQAVEIAQNSGDAIAAEAFCSRFPLPEGNHVCHVLLLDVRARDSRDRQRTARLAKLSLLNQVSDALYGAHLTLDQILEAVLICVTAGQGLRFNRAFLLLIDEAKKSLRGEIAIGPSDHAEASRIWSDLADEPADLFEMMTTYDRSLRETDVAVNEIVRYLVVDLAENDHFLIQAMNSHQPILVSDGLAAPGVAEICGLLRHGTFAVAPLITRRGPLGVLIADNAISGSEISDLELEFLQLFADQSANAIENSRLYHELEGRLRDLHKAHQRQKEDQETLLRMERLSVMGETSAIVAHELRNPLVSIGGFARTLVRNLDADDTNRQFAQIITEEVSRLERIIHDLLDFIRPQKRLRKIVVCDQLVALSADRMRDLLAEKKTQLVFALESRSAEVSCHPGEIQQVIQNLIVNAHQVSEPGSVIEVASQLLEGGVEVAIRDEGPGFAADLADKLFAPFFTTKTSGSGLGLTICSQIIKAHGGLLRASNRTTRGAEFAFILPLPRSNGEAGSDES